MEAGALLGGVVSLGQVGRREGSSNGTQKSAEGTRWEPEGGSERTGADSPQSFLRSFYIFLGLTTLFFLSVVPCSRLYPRIGVGETLTGNSVDVPASI